MRCTTDHSSWVWRGRELCYCSFVLWGLITYIRRYRVGGGRREAWRSRFSLMTTLVAFPHFPAIVEQSCVVLSQLQRYSSTLAWEHCCWYIVLMNRLSLARLYVLTKKVLWETYIYTSCNALVEQCNSLGQLDMDSPSESHRIFALIACSPYSL